MSTRPRKIFMKKITYLFLLLPLSVYARPDTAQPIQQIGKLDENQTRLNQYAISSQALLNQYISLIGNSNSSHVLLFTPYILEKTFYPISIGQYSNIDKNAVGWYGSDGLTSDNLRFSLYVHYTLGNPRFVLMLHYPYTQNYSCALTFSEFKEKIKQYGFTEKAFTPSDGFGENSHISKFSFSKEKNNELLQINVDKSNSCLRHLSFSLS